MKSPSSCAVQCVCRPHFRAPPTLHLPHLGHDTQTAVCDISSSPRSWLEQWLNWTTKALAALSGRVIAKEQLPELSEARQWYDSSRSFSRAMLFAAVLYLLLARYNHESEGVRVPYARPFSTMHCPANLFPSSPSGFCDVGVISFKVRVSDPSLDFFCSIFYFSH